VVVVLDERTSIFNVSLSRASDHAHLVVLKLRSPVLFCDGGNAQQYMTSSRFPGRIFLNKEPIALLMLLPPLQENSFLMMMIIVFW